MCQLMQTNICEPKSYGVCHLSWWFQKFVIERDDTYVLHRTNPELIDKDLIILRKWELHTKELFIVPNTYCGDSKHFISVKISCLCLAREDPHSWQPRFIS